MYRRDLLRAGVGLFGAGGLLGSVSGRGSDEYAPEGRVGVPGAKEAVADDDGFVYLAVTDGYAIVDARDPASPEIVARDGDVGPEDGSLGMIWDVKYANDRLLVPGQPRMGGGGPLGFAYVDVSDPTDPEQILYHDLEFGIHNCFLDGTTAYLTGGAGPDDTFTVVDLSGDAARRVSTWSATDASEAWATAFAGGGAGAHDIWVDGDLAYAATWDAGVFVVDVADRADPTFVANVGGFDPETIAEWSDRKRRNQTFRPPGNAHYVATTADGDLLGVGGEAWQFEGEGGPMGIDLYDVTDPSAPERLATVEPPSSPDRSLGGLVTTSHNFEFRDGTLYSSWYRGGVKRHDVSEPREPVEETWYRRPEATSFWTARVLDPGETFLASSKGTERRGRDAALYLFPDEPGRSVEPYDYEATTRTTGTPGTPTTPVETTDTTESTTTDAETTGTRRSSTAGSTPATEATDGGATPGFGALTAAAALGVGAWRALRSDDRTGR